VQGKQLSYNNINDTDAAFELAAEFDPEVTAAVVIIKHANPCGVAEAGRWFRRTPKALACDPVSAFGGIVALNRTLDADAAAAIVEFFTEVIIAPTRRPRRGISSPQEEFAPSGDGGLPIPARRGVR
jgi:phosphoribosylaminoimidazolecarboxamide formyltransferase / IMP cyclohydrolase